ncbi:MAG: response regulator [Sandaracinaceae bacterium]|nr:response regulator [Sandaracinaceae bacterium]
MSKRRVILLVEDDGAHAQLALRQIERSDDLAARVVETIAQAREVLAHEHVDLVLADLRLPDGSALELLDDETALVVQTSQGDEARAVAAMKGGALDYCVKSPEMYRDLPIILERALNAAHERAERRRAERSLRESDERFRQLAASIPEVFWLFDLATRQIVFASPAWEAVYGAAPRTWEGRLAHVHPDDVAASWALGPSEGDTFRIIEGASTRWVEERRFWTHDAEGHPFRLSCLAVDVTRRRELELELRHAQKMQALGQLAGGVAHDFNNTLSAILLAGRELADGGADPELCELILAAGARARDLTRNLLSFARRKKSETSVVDIHAVLREALTLLSRGLEAHTRLVTSLDATRTSVRGDASQLQSAFLNLGINARDAMPSGGELRVRTREVELDADACRASAFELEPGRYLELRVEDTGEGIAPEILPRVFEPFFTTKERGTGLGLAAVYGTAVEHRGAVTLRSERGVGTEVIVLLPLTDHPRSTVDDPRSSTPSLTGGLVLFVDDEPLVREAARRMLERAGFDVLTATDGAEGWAAFEAHRDALVAVISDVSMPKLDGPGLVRRIREAASTLPCVLCTGYLPDGLHAIEGPFLAKPFSRDDLLRAIDEARRGLARSA